MNRKRQNQMGMFAETSEDLPLFSGACVRVVEPGERPAIEDAQQTLFEVRCRACGDTGVVGHQFCLCPAGREAQAAAMRSRVATDARQLASGTIASLTGRRLYAEVDPIQADFVTFCEVNAGRYVNWGAAWEVFWPAYQRHMTPLVED